MMMPIVDITPNNVCPRNRRVGLASIVGSYFWSTTVPVMPVWMCNHAGSKERARVGCGEQAVSDGTIGARVVREDTKTPESARGARLMPRLIFRVISRSLDECGSHRQYIAEETSGCCGTRWLGKFALVFLVVTDGFKKKKKMTLKSFCARLSASRASELPPPPC